MYEVTDLHPHQKKCLDKLRTIEKGTSVPISSLASSDQSYFLSLVKTLINIGYTEYSMSYDFTHICRDNGRDYGITELNEIICQK